MLLTDGAALRISQSPRLFGVERRHFRHTSTRLHADEVSREEVLQDADSVRLLFSRLIHVSVRLSALAAVDRAGHAKLAKRRLRRNPYCLKRLIPFLTARSTSLPSLHVAKFRMRNQQRAIAELPALLAPRMSMRRLHLDGVVPLTDLLATLLNLPLDTLDLPNSILDEKVVDESSVS